MEPIKITLKRAEKLEAIYKEMANKELTFWCRVNTEYWRIVSIVEETADERWYIVVSEESLYNDEDLGAYYCWLRVRWLEDMEQIDIAEIIWHPVTIGDVIDWIEPYWAGYAQDVRFTEERRRKINLILLQWDKKREPIESQSDECIDYVYSLIPSKSME